MPTLARPANCLLKLCLGTRARRQDEHPAEEELARPQQGQHRARAEGRGRGGGEGARGQAARGACRTRGEWLEETWG